MWDSLISAKSDARLLDPMQKLRVMLEPIFEPILFRCKSDEDAGRTTMPCDDITASLMRPWRHHVSRARSPDPRRLCSHESRLAPRRLRLPCARGSKEMPNHRPRPARIGARTRSSLRHRDGASTSCTWRPMDRSHIPQTRRRRPQARRAWPGAVTFPTSDPVLSSLNSCRANDRRSPAAARDRIGGRRVYRHVGPPVRFCQPNSRVGA